MEPSTIVAVWPSRAWGSCPFTLPTSGLAGPSYSGRFFLITLLPRVSPGVRGS